MSRDRVGPQGRAFLNRLKSLDFVDGHMLPELTQAEQARFMHDPAYYLVRAGEAQQAAVLDELGMDKAKNLGAEQKRRILDARVGPGSELTIEDALAAAEGGTGLTPEDVLDAVIRELLQLAVIAAWRSG